MLHSMNTSSTINCERDVINGTCQQNDEVMEHFDEVANIPVSITICVFTMFIVAMNIPAALTLIKTKFKQSNIQNMQVLSLSITDILVGISQFMITYDFIYAQPIAYRSCVARFVLWASCYFNSMTQVFVLCFCRVYVFFKLRPMIHHGRDLAKIIIATFLISMFMMSLPLLLTTIHMDHTKTLKRCTPDLIFHPSMWSYIAVAYTGIEIMIIVCYLVLVYKLYLHRKKMRKVVPAHTLSNENTTDLNVKIMNSREARSIIIIGVIVLMYIICTTPFHIMCIVEMLKLGRSSRKMRNLFTVLASCNSALNPIVYAFMVPEMKKSIRNTVCRPCQ